MPLTIAPVPWHLGNVGLGVQNLCSDKLFNRAEGTQEPEGRTLKVIPTLLFLLCVEMTLVLFYIVSDIILFDLSDERSIATWFSSSQLLLIGLILSFAAWRKRRPETEAVMFATAGLGFIFLSADEASGLHERITYYTVRYDVDFMPRFEGDHGVWIFVYLLLGLTLSLLFRRALIAIWRHRRPVALLVGAGFLIIVAGGALIEILGYYKVMTGKMQVSTEEFLEMFGASLVLIGAIMLISR